MAVYYKKGYEKKKKIKFKKFFLISVIFLLIGIILKSTKLTDQFVSEVSIFVFAIIFLVGIVYSIMNKIMYLTKSKIEKIGSWLFYIGLSSIILRLASEVIFNKTSYISIFPYEQIHNVIMIILTIGIGLFFLSLVMLLLKFKKLFKFFSKL